MRPQILESSQTIMRARPCSKCDYDLRGLQRHGRCPECATPYKKRREDEKPKNPTRQLAHLNHSLKHHRQEFASGMMYWLLAVLAITACIVFSAGKAYWALAACAVIFAAGNHVNEWVACREIQNKIKTVNPVKLSTKPE